MAKQATRERSRPAKKGEEVLKRIVSDEVPIHKLLNYEFNARVHSPVQIDALADAIARFGFTNPVLVWNNNEIIAGHGRVLAARKLLAMDEKKYAALKTLPVRRCDGLSDPERRALALADNKLSEMSGFDDAMLAKEVQSLWDKEKIEDIPGFSQEELVVLRAEEDTSLSPEDGTAVETVEFSRRMKSSEEFVQFEVVLSIADRKAVNTALEKIKKKHKLKETDEALMVLARSYKGAKNG